MRATADLARSFGEAFGAGDLTWALGIAHDAGKVRDAWQRRLSEVAASGSSVGSDHKALGTQLLFKRALGASLAVWGHHGGLVDARDLQTVVHDGDVQGDLRRFFAIVPEAEALVDGPSLVPEAWSAERGAQEFGIRMAFSALVDADHLDTAAHFDGVPVRLRPPVDMRDLMARFDAGRRQLLEGRGSSKVDAVRGALFDEVMGSAKCERGVYRLPAPTGSGKTLTAGAFALRHAAHHRMSRVVVAVPFTTVTEQNAAVYRRLLGSDIVLEHHSNTEVDEGSECGFGRRGVALGAENWDAPFVVTTTVQLFDSLFGRKPARSRKLHRLANSVIVLDEVHTLPVPLLEPILDGLRLLVRYFGASVVLASATQPAFEYFKAGEKAQIKPLVVDPVRLYGSLKRVRYEWRVDPKPTLAQIADEVARQNQALVVVNTVDNARVLFRLVEEADPKAAVFHLSTRMVPRHRRDVLKEVGSLLGDGKPVVVVSTQLVECGVDLDFPVVFRALAPAESLQQAAGRANREGRLPEPGRVVVFDAADATTPQFYRAGVAKTLSFFGPDVDPDDPVVLESYYRAFFTGLNPEEQKRPQTIAQARSDLDFRVVADGPVIKDDRERATQTRDSSLAFRMIDDDSVPVVVTDFGDTDRIRELIRRVAASEGPLREVFRELRGHMVRLPRRMATGDSAVAALCRPLVSGQRQVWEWLGEYDEQVGIDVDAIGEETIW
ncbi:CRISPR-associated helicase Cas3' [Actinokineospora sp. UTMC 2448]|uniref:CRISPR-associated helicase Cas3' n=1 Tax=Actinokineospora sp. UTMC 2448 TaxID=2268449 RepID=UPI00216491AD|nr:CRISPR-associated helicase Cas3' [Actinokineospora sp. UTMC 2448]UVS80619.1 helicase Cas3 [Actinokineospora sp. UTMC 2448]